jgi:hypothetical protein
VVAIVALAFEAGTSSRLTSTIAAAVGYELLAARDVTGHDARARLIRKSRSSVSYPRTVPSAIALKFPQ